MNVAMHLHHLGLPSALISRVGCDAFGHDMLAFIASQNSTTAYIQRDETYQTGIVEVVLSAELNATYTIVEPVAWDFIELNDEIIRLVENAQAFVFGSLACRNPESYSSLHYLLKKASFKVFDVNFRSPFYNQTLLEELLPQADLVKMNEEELAIMAQWYGLKTETLPQKADFISQKMGIKTLIVTCGKDGAMLLEKGEWYACQGYTVTVADTIGSGDAFLAGFLKNYLEGQPMQHALDYACALGALVATQKGANPVIEEVRISQLMQERQSEYLVK